MWEHKSAKTSIKKNEDEQMKPSNQKSRLLDYFQNTKPKKKKKQDFKTEKF